MTVTGAKGRQLEHLLALVLHSGTWVASIAIGFGLALAFFQAPGPNRLSISPGMRIVTLGIALFILLPSARVFLMLIVFFRDRDYCFSIIAALVLLIILLGYAFGMRSANPGPLPALLSVVQN